MSNTIVVQVVHAQDADQHLGFITGILENLKAENRIGNYNFLPHDSVTDASFESLSEKDMVVTMLTNGLMGLQGGIEEALIAIKLELPKYKMVEVIIDNVRYHPDFIALPTNLEPIRESENMDAVWQGIDEKFKVLFPKPTPAPPRPKWKKYVPYVLGFIVLVGLFFLYQKITKDVTKLELEIETKIASTSEVVIRCPGEHVFVVEGEIKVNKKIKLMPVWELSDGTTIQNESLTLKAGESKKLYYKWKLDADSHKKSKYWIKLRVLDSKEIAIENGESKKNELFFNCSFFSFVVTSIAPAGEFLKVKGRVEYGSLNQGQNGQKLIYKEHQKRMMLRRVEGSDFPIEAGESAMLTLGNFSQMSKSEIRRGDTLKILRYSY